MTEIQNSKQYDLENRTFEFAKKAIYASLFFALFFCGMSLFQIFYIPSVHDINHCHYNAILSVEPRIIAASFFTYFVVQFLDLKFYAFLKKVFKKHYFIIRNSFSLLKNMYYLNMFLINSPLAERMLWRAKKQNFI